MKTAASSGSSSPSSISILADSASTRRAGAIVPGRDPRRRSAARAQVALADVEEDQHRLLGQEAEAADAPSPRRRRARRRGSAARAERRWSRSRISSSRSFASRSAGVPWWPVAPSRSTPLLDHRQVGQDELEVQALEVAPRVDRAVGMGHAGVLEGAHDVEQRVGFAQPGEVLGRQLLGADVALGRRGGAGRSTYVTSAWTIFFGWKISARRSRRSSGTLTTPTLRSCRRSRRSGHGRG